MKKIFLVCIVFLLTLSGCSSLKTTLAYTVYPIGYLLERLTDGIIDIETIQSDDLAQVAKIKDDYKEILDDSTYFFHIGELEPYLDLYDEEIKESGVNVIDLSKVNAIYKFERYTLVYIDGNESYVEGPYYNSALFDKIDTTENDLFIWIDPIGMLSMASDIYDLLSKNYVEEADRFKENYEKLESDLTSLDAAYQNLVSELRKENTTIKFVTMSASFGNWQKAYGFQVYPICLSKYGSLPSDKELEVIKKRIIEDDVKYIAYEPNMTQEMRELFNELEDELGLTRVNLNNCSSLTLSQLENNSDYLSLMYENLSVLENMAAQSIEEVTQDENALD